MIVDRRFNMLKKKKEQKVEEKLFINAFTKVLLKFSSYQIE